MSSPAPRRPAFETWPTLKVISYPQSGRLPQPDLDEWCFTLCTQNARNRSQMRDPLCRTVCIRKVFPHEVRNILSYKQHPNVGPDGYAKYPLPQEGQPGRLPRMLGGKPPDDSDTSKTSSERKSKYWKEGWYLWTSTTLPGAWDRMEAMKYDVQLLQQRELHRQKIRETWQEYQEFKERQLIPIQDGPIQDGKWYGLIVPRKPFPDTSSDSLLFSLPPEITLFDRIHKVLAPTHRALDIFDRSVKSGALYSFGERVWEKAWTKEPFLLAEHAFNKACELWKAGPPDDEDDSKNSSR